MIQRRQECVFTRAQLKVTFIENVLSPSDAAAAFRTLLQTVDWRTRRKGGNGRINCSYGDGSIQSAYGVKVVPWSQAPPILLQYKKLVEQLTSEPANYCVLQLYPKKGVGIKRHRDKEVVRGTCIAGLSLGSSRTLRMSPAHYSVKTTSVSMSTTSSEQPKVAKEVANATAAKAEAANDESTHHADARHTGHPDALAPLDIVLPAGSLYILHPPTNDHWMHEILPHATDDSPRISITYRYQPKNLTALPGGHSRYPPQTAADIEAARALARPLIQLLLQKLEQSHAKQQQRTLLQYWTKSQSPAKATMRT